MLNLAKNCSVNASIYIHHLLIINSKAQWHKALILSCRSNYNQKAAKTVSWWTYRNHCRRQSVRIHSRTKMLKLYISCLLRDCHIDLQVLVLVLLLGNKCIVWPVLWEGYLPRNSLQKTSGLLLQQAPTKIEIDRLCVGSMSWNIKIRDQSIF